MRGFEQIPDFNGNQVSNAVGAVSLGMPSQRIGNNPFMPAPEEQRWVAEEGWKERGMCNQIGTAMFYLKKGENPKEAKKVCASCEVQPQCLEAALNEGERFGVWGGKTERERRALRKIREQASKPQES